MAEINEEFIAEYSRVVGNAYVEVNKGIGDETTPGTAVFNLNQLINLAENKQPFFGIINSGNTTSFEVTVDENDSKFINVSAGKITYNNNVLNVAPKRISVSKLFANTYSSAYVYGMRIGFPITEAKKTVNVLYSSVLKSNYVSGQNVIYIDNPQRIINLGFPITAYVGANTYVVFERATSDKTGLVIDSGINNGSLNVNFAVGTNINFVYEPKIRAVYGIPVSVSSHDPSEFKYFPPMPSSWLPIADILVINPNDPEVDSFGLNPAILRTAIDYPDANINPPLFSSADSQIIAKQSKATKNQLTSNKNRASVYDSVKALEFYTSALQENKGKTFRQFWASRPLASSTYFNKGINYEGLERFEFSDNYSDAYYELNNKDLNRTFAIFRGDLYSNPSTINGSGPTSVTLDSKNDFKGINSSLTNGTYYYGVSAVITTGETRETPTTYSSVITTPNSPNYANVIQWTPVANAQFYHIYRKSTNSGEQVEFRLTDVNTIKGAGPINNPSVTPNTQVSLTTDGIAFKVTPTGASEMHLGGIYFKLKATDSELTNTSDYVQVELYTNNVGDGKPGTLISEAVFDTVTFETILRNNSGLLSEDFKKIILKTNYKLLSGYSYWVVLRLNNLPSTGDIQLFVSNAAASNLFATYAGAIWTLVNNITPDYELLGFVDNGITGVSSVTRGLYLTKKITKEPRRLRIYVPEVASHPYLNPYTGPNASLQDQKTTRNEMIVTITAQNGTDTPVVLPSVTIPQYTTQATEFLLGTSTQIFDRVLDVQVAPGASVVRGALNSIDWHKYDLFVVENVP